MKLNEKGLTLVNKWFQIYAYENDRLGGNSLNGYYVDGWCIIDNNCFIKTLDDVSGIYIMGYECGNGYCDALDVIDEWMESNNDREDDECCYGFTYKEIKEKMMEYFEA